MKKENMKDKPLLKEVLRNNFLNRWLYSDLKKDLESKLLTINGLISNYYKPKFFPLIFTKIEELFSYKYNKEMSLIDNISSINEKIKRVNNFIQYESLLEDLVKWITEQCGIQYESIIKTKDIFDTDEDEEEHPPQFFQVESESDSSSTVPLSNEVNCESEKSPDTDNFETVKKVTESIELPPLELPNWKQPKIVIHVW
ncbi:hypothetical protein [Spiroplasma endosymbiont of Nebria brevicollis]|uniref:hypothetical protein n=1 Tax=Spiroplasma endosymbiont of Nebria brevicollis TaxID=3066284 RepID=UPI00313C952C